MNIYGKAMAETSDGLTAKVVRIPGHVNNRSGAM
jgi:hypothetical protein